MKWAVKAYYAYSKAILRLGLDPEGRHSHEVHYAEEAEDVVPAPEAIPDVGLRGPDVGQVFLGR